MERNMEGRLATQANIHQNQNGLYQVDALSTPLFNLPTRVFNLPTLSSNLPTPF